MKIYFAGSIRGGREHESIYLELIEHLSKHGTVLSDHVGSSEYAAKANEEFDKRIHDKAVYSIYGSDVFVAEVSTPSTGVGYEIKAAIMYKKKVLCLYKIGSKKEVSAMISGCKDLTLKKYKEVEEAKKYVDEFIQKLQ